MQTFTAIPNEFLDRVAPTLKPVELRIMLYIYRRTLGFNKQEDTIAYSQFINGITTKSGNVLDFGAGVSRRALIDALKRLETLGLIERLQATKHGVLIRLQQVQVLHAPKQNLHSTKQEDLLQDKDTPDLLPAIKEKLPDMPEKQARELIQKARKARKNAVAWLISLLEYVTTQPHIKRPVAAFTWLVRENKDVLPTSNNTDRIKSKMPIDYAKYAPGGKYGGRGHGYLAI